jgi:hypothetical protein
MLRPGNARTIVIVMAKIPRLGRIDQPSDHPTVHAHPEPAIRPTRAPNPTAGDDPRPSRA